MCSNHEVEFWILQNSTLSISDEIRTQSVSRLFALLTSPTSLDWLIFRFGLLRGHLVVLFCSICALFLHIQSSFLLSCQDFVGFYNTHPLHFGRINHDLLLTTANFDFFFFFLLMLLFILFNLIYLLLLFHFCILGRTCDNFRLTGYFLFHKSYLVLLAICFFSSPFCLNRTDDYLLQLFGCFQTKRRFSIWVSIVLDWSDKTCLLLFNEAVAWILCRLN